MAVLNCDIAGQDAECLAAALEAVLKTLEHLRFSACGGDGGFLLSCEVHGTELANKLRCLLPGPGGSIGTTSSQRTGIT